MLNTADIVFLFLPDDASREAVSWIENPNTVVLDTSTAHRTAPGWTYGFSELVGTETVASSKRIAVPGCQASGFIALITPLIQSGLLSAGALLSCFSLTGYSGGGKKMIAEYESPDRSVLLDAPRQYALGQMHKHLKEMQASYPADRCTSGCPYRVQPFGSCTGFHDHEHLRPRPQRE